MSEESNVNWVFWKSHEEQLDVEKISEMYNALYEASSTPTKIYMKTVELKEGIKYETKEIIKKTPIYKMGQYDGRKEQAAQTSEKYEKKLKKQAQHFQEQKVLLEKDISDLNDLIKEYERYIREKESQFEYLSKEQSKELEELKKKYEALKDILKKKSL